MTGDDTAVFFFFSSRGRQTRCALVTGVQTCALPISSLGYVDDAAFAASRAASLSRRGYGQRRVDQALHAAGIEEADAAPAKEQASAGAMAAALRFAQRRRLGPYAAIASEIGRAHV